MDVNKPLKMVWNVFIGIDPYPHHSWQEKSSAMSPAVFFWFPKQGGHATDQAASQPGHMCTIFGTAGADHIRLATPCLDLEGEVSQKRGFLLT